MSEKLKALTAIERVEIKQDLIFGMLSNQFLAGQALEAYQATHKNEDEQSKDIASKSAEAFKYHNKNLIDSVDYYVNMFGQASNDRIVEVLIDMGYKEAPDAPTASAENEPEAVTEVKVGANRTSIVDESGK